MTFHEVGKYIAKRSGVEFIGVSFENGYPLFSFRIEMTFFIGVWGKPEPAEPKENIGLVLETLHDSLSEWLLRAEGVVQ